MDYQFQIGDEIGLFSDTLCVGAEIFDGSENLAITAWEGSDQYLLPGFNDGDSIRIVIWADVGDGESEYELEPTFIIGDGTYGFGSYSVCYFSVPTAILEVSALEHDFGRVSVGSLSNNWIFTIFNRGWIPMIINIISSQTDSIFTLSYYTISSLMPDDSLQVSVNFIPPSIGFYSDTILINTTAPINGIASIILQGTGVDTSIIFVNQEYFPEGFRLGQNYPNPFNPITEIPYYLPSTSHVSLKIFNINGQEVAMILDRIQDSGDHVATWKADQFSNGIYLIKAISNGNTHVRRIVLLK